MARDGEGIRDDAERPRHRLDHVLIVVRDLSTAVADYTALGFSVVAGGDHAGGVTHNALIGFADGTYLELIAFRQPRVLRLLRVLDRLGTLNLLVARRTAFERRFLQRAIAGVGLTDLAVLTSALRDDVEAARTAGVQIATSAGGRTRTDGRRIVFEVGVPSLPELPFLIADVTPRSLRAPTDGNCLHANGATGIAGVTLVARDRRGTAARYRRLIESEGESESDGSASIIRLGGTTLRLVAGDSVPAEPDDVVELGRGLRALVLRTGAGDSPGHVLDIARTHGAQIAFQSRA